MRVARRVTLSESERTTLESWSRQERENEALALRARIVLLAAQGYQNKQIAEELGTDRRTAARWRMRFLAKGLEGVRSRAPRVPKKPAPRDVLAPLILETTLHTPPTHGKYWSTRTLAAKLGVSRSMVDRVWRANGIKPRQLTYATSTTTMLVSPDVGTLSVPKSTRQVG